MAESQPGSAACASSPLGGPPKIEPAGLGGGDAGISGKSSAGGIAGSGRAHARTTATLPSPAPTVFSPLPLHDALPISVRLWADHRKLNRRVWVEVTPEFQATLRPEASP